MKRKGTQITLTATSSASASTTTAHTGTGYAGAGTLSSCEGVTIDAKIVGGTGGTLDIYLQRKIAADTWRDWVHFPQVAAGATKYYTVTIVGDGSTITEVGNSTDAAATPALAANSVANVTPTGDVRIVSVTGGGLTVAGNTTIVLTPIFERF
jgi:hypothetical protein